MTQLILTLIIEILIIAPLIVIGSNRADIKWKHLLLFVAYYFLYVGLLAMPNWFPQLRIIEGDWNWSGKIYAITGSILFYLLFRKSLGTYNYATLKQNDTSLKPKTVIIIIAYLVAVGLGFFFIKNAPTNLESLMFQSIMPGLDEELAFRGIMIGLLSNSLRSKVQVGSIHLGNPALLITAILFGLGHSFQIDSNWIFYQNWFEFINMFAIGLLLGWLTIKSGSFLTSIVVHSLICILPIITLILIKSW